MAMGICDTDARIHSSFLFWQYSPCCNLKGQSQLSSCSLFLWSDSDVFSVMTSLFCTSYHWLLLVIWLGRGNFSPTSHVDTLQLYNFESHYPRAVVGKGNCVFVWQISGTAACGNCPSSWLCSGENTRLFFNVFSWMKGQFCFMLAIMNTQPKEW